MLSQGTGKKYCISNELQLWLALEEDIISPENLTKMLRKALLNITFKLRKTWMER